MGHYKSNKSYAPDMDTIPPFSSELTIISTGFSKTVSDPRVTASSSPKSSISGERFKAGGFFQLFPFFLLETKVLHYS